MIKKHWKFLTVAVSFSLFALAGPSTNRTIVADFIKTVGGSRPTWTIQNTANDTFVGRATTDTLTNKTMDGATNTWTNIPAATALTGKVSVANGGTGLSTGTAAGIPFFSATNTMSTSGALTAHGLMISEGTSAPITVTASSAGQVLQSASSADPTWTSTPTLGVTGATTGILNLAGLTSGLVTIQPQSAAGTYNFNLPITVGSSGQPLLSGGGGSSAMTFGTLGVAAGGTGQTSYTDGQLLIGNSSTGLLSKATLSAGTNITITNGNGTISIAASPSAFPAYNYTSQTTTYSAAVNDYILASGASFAITLPTAVGQSGKGIVIQHNGTSLSQVYTLNTTSAQTIGGVASGSYALYTLGEVVGLISDGSNWRVIYHYAKTDWNLAGTTTISATSAYVFTCTAANATIGAVYSNNGQTFTVSATIAGGTTLNASGTGTPGASGTLTKVSGSGDSTITFSSKTITGVPVYGTVSQNVKRWRRDGQRMFVEDEVVHIGAGNSGSGDYIWLGPPANASIDLTNITVYQTVIGSAQAKFTNVIGTGAAFGNTDTGVVTIHVYDSTHIRAYVSTSSLENMMNSASNFGLGQATFGFLFKYDFMATGFQP